ncbi:flagellar export protein FliJ [Lachnospiraceae bacterium YH-ros2228]|nr:flagellar export protein FliJ [Lachnospiraceae bacterium]
MKKFHYSLETVLDYKQRILDSILEEYAVWQQRIEERKTKIQTLRKEKRNLEDSFDKLQHAGGSIEKFLLYADLIDRMDREIEVQKEKLKELEKEAEKVKKKVIDAKIDVNKFEKLKEKKFQSYRLAEQKENEAFIDEFVQNQTSRPTG